MAEVGLDDVVVVVVIGVVVVTLLSFAHSTSCGCPNSAARGGGGGGVVDGEEDVDGESAASSPAALGTSGDDDCPAEELIATGAAARADHSQTHVAVIVRDSTGGPHGSGCNTYAKEVDFSNSLAIEEGVASTFTGRYPSGRQVTPPLAIAVRGERAGSTGSSAGTVQRED